MNLVDKYFPIEDKQERKQEPQVNMEEITEVVKLQIDNAMKKAVEELKNNIKEGKENDNNIKVEQGTQQEGEISPHSESGNSDNQQA